MALDNSLFASQDVEAHDIELGDGSKHILHFKEATAGAFSRYAVATRSNDESVRAGAAAHLVAACLVNPDGSPALTFDQVLILKIDALERILSKVFEINNRIKKKSDEEQKISSGTS